MYVKYIALFNHKTFATNTGQYIAQEMTDETNDSARTKKETSVAIPTHCQAQYCVEQNAINKLTSA